jgi:hypothetical protein
MTDLAIRPQSTAVVPGGDWNLMQQQATALAASDIIPKAYQRKPANVLVAAITGRHYGWDVLTAMRNGHIIEGNWGMKPEAMLGLVRQHGHSVSGSMSETGATVTGKRADTGDELTISFTIEDAKRAKLTNKGTWQAYPANMCYWRAVGMLCRMLFSDLTAGVMSAEEWGADIDPDGNVIEVEVVEPQGPIPLSAEQVATFRGACEQVSLSPDAVLADAFGARTPDPLLDEHLPLMRAAYNRLLEQAKAQDEIVEAEVVEADLIADTLGEIVEEIVEAHIDNVVQLPIGERDPTARSATKPQVGQIKALFKALGVEDRDAQLEWTREIIARHVETHNDLTTHEASEVIDRLKKAQTEAGE